MSKQKKVKEKDIKEVDITDENSVEETNETKSEDNVKQLEQEVADLKDKLLRKAAEFENYKRRTENDQINLITFAAESFIQKLLPVIDDFERSLGHVDEAEDINAIKQGLKLIYDKLLKVLDIIDYACV